MRVHIGENFGSALIPVYVLMDRPDGVYIQRSHANGTVTNDFFTKQGESPEGTPAPSFQVDMRVARLLVDALSGKGFMPGEVGQIRGELTATKLHLEDMRKIAMTALELENKKTVDP